MKATIRFSAKCSDMSDVEIIDEAGKLLYHHTGYVPRDIGFGGGDYVEFNVDAETGQILNWKPVNVEDIDGTQR